MIIKTPIVLPANESFELSRPRKADQKQGLCSLYKKKTRKKSRHLLNIKKQNKTKKHIYLGTMELEVDSAGSNEHREEVMEASFSAHLG